MRAHRFLFTLACVLLLSCPAFAQQTDHYTGTFVHSESGLTVSCAKTADGYQGWLLWDGKKHAFTGFKFLGMMNGAFTYQGGEVSFSLARILGVYYFTHDGNSIELSRTSETPASGPAVAAKPAAQPQTSSPAPAASAKPAAAAPAAPAVPSGAGASPSTGAKFTDPYGAFSFRAPAGWAGKADGGGFALSKAGANVTLAVASHAYNSVAELRKDVIDVNDHENKIYLKGTTQPYGGNGLLIRFSGTAQGRAIVLETISLLSPHGGGVSLVGAGPKTDYNAAYTELLKSIAASVVFMKAPASPAAEQWKQKFQGKELLFLQTEGGSSTKISIQLCRNGRFTYASNDSYMSGGFNSFSYAGSDGGEGVWRVASKSGQPMLILNYQGGSTGEYALTARSASNEVSLNGRRYIIRQSSYCP